MTYVAIALWLLCGVAGEIIQRRALRMEGLTPAQPWIAFPINAALGPVALIGCLLAYP